MHKESNLNNGFPFAYLRNALKFRKSAKHVFNRVEGDIFRFKKCIPGKLGAAKGRNLKIKV